MERRKGRSVDRNRDTFRARERERTTKTDRSSELPSSELSHSSPSLNNPSFLAWPCLQLTHKRGRRKEEGAEGEEHEGELLESWEVIRQGSGHLQEGVYLRSVTKAAHIQKFTPVPGTVSSLNFTSQSLVTLMGRAYYVIADALTNTPILYLTPPTQCGRETITHCTTLAHPPQREKLHPRA